MDKLCINVGDIPMIPQWSFRFIEWMEMGSPVDSVCPDCDSRSFFIGIKDLGDGRFTYYASCGRCDFRLEIHRKKTGSLDFDHFMETI